MMEMDNVLKGMNWFGLVTGILLLVLPFLGPWWSATAGTGAMTIAFSPFDMYTSFLGQTLQSSLVGIFLLATKISFILAGVFMIIGSISPGSWWGKHLVGYGMMKTFWSVISLVVMVAIGAFAFNNVLPGIITGAAGGAGNVTAQLNVPYVSGSAVSTIQVQGGALTVTVPITASLTGTFWAAVGIAAMGVVTRIYQRKLVPPEKKVKEGKTLKLKPTEERKVIKLKPAEDEDEEKPAEKTLKLKAK